MPASIIRLRGDTKANWKTANAILKQREWGIEWETTVGVGEVNVKIGDGVTSWNDLNYAIISDITKKVVKTFSSISESNPVISANATLEKLFGQIKKKFDYVIDSIDAVKLLAGTYQAMNISTGAGSTVTANDITEALTYIEQYKLTKSNIYDGRDSTSKVLAASASSVHQNHVDIGDVASLASGSGNCVSAINQLNSDKASLAGTNNYTGIQILDCQSGAQANSWEYAPVRISADYATNSSFRAQIALENKGSNAGILWLDRDGCLRFTDNTGATHTLNWT